MLRNLCAHKPLLEILELTAPVRATRTHACASGRWRSQRRRIVSACGRQWLCARQGANTAAVGASMARAVTFVCAGRLSESRPDQLVDLRKTTGWLGVHDDCHGRARQGTLRRT